MNQKYIEIDHDRIPVSEEVYRAYKRPEWAEHKRKERSKRCVIAGVRCSGDCSKCPHDRTGSILSLDKFLEYGLEPTDHSANVEDIVCEQMILEDLLQALEELDPDGKLLCQLIGEGVSERQIAERFGISQVAVNKRKKKLFSYLRDLLGEY